MQQPIVGFHQDDEGHWVAELACGHAQHLRHDPPWQERPWVLEALSRSERLGSLLNCVECGEVAFVIPGLGSRVAGLDEAPAHLSCAAAEAYLDARMQGLCHDGALEIANRIDRENRS